MAEIDFPEADRLGDTPHPRDSNHLIGQEEAEMTFLDAFSGGRMHHAWLVTGPRGVGKSTLAWRIARFLLTTPLADNTGLFGAVDPPVSLDVDPDHPVVHRMRAGAEPRLFLLRRPYDHDAKRLKKDITVDEARKLKRFFSMSATEPGRRVVIIDSADELNANAANAILKILEEPPENTIMFLIAHQQSRLLPTIRSRCRTLRCHPLAEEPMGQVLGQHTSPALSELAQGSVGDAMQLMQSDGLEAYQALIGLFERLPDIDRQAALKLAESSAGRGKEDQFDLNLRLCEQFLSRLARTGAGRPPLVAAALGEIELLQRLSPNLRASQSWADLQQSISDRVRRGRAVNLDPAALILDMVLKIRDTAAALAVG